MRIPGTFFLRNLVERRSLLFQLVRRDFEQRFVGSAIGWVWGVIHPLVLLLSYTFIFSVCLKQGQLMQNYPLFLFAGMLPWLLFSDTVQRSSACLLDNANLITKTVFPAEVMPVSIFLSSLASHAIALVLIVVAIAVWMNHISVMVLWIPLYAFLLGLMAVGFGWIAASLQVYVRDTAQVLSVVLTCWFWMTPIFITEDQFPHGLRFLIASNPLAYIVRAYRMALLSYRWPAWKDMAVISAYSIGSFVVGGLFFRQMKRGFADVL